MGYAGIDRVDTAQAHEHKIRQMLPAVPLFQGLESNSGFIADVAKVITERHVSAGELIIEKGAVGDEM